MIHPVDGYKTSTTTELPTDRPIASACTGSIRAVLFLECQRKTINRVERIGDRPPAVADSRESTGRSDPPGEDPESLGPSNRPTLGRRGQRAVEPFPGGPRGETLVAMCA